MNLLQSSFPEWYKEIEALGDPLTGISDRIDFERIRPILSDLYDNNTEKGGRPNYDPVLMVKILLLQQWYNLSDPQVEREIRDRISFMNFLGYPEKLPDRNTIWHFRERLWKTGKDRLVFNEIRDQIMARHIRVKKGTMQDASFIEADRGEYGKPRGDDANTRRSKDGTSATKNHEKHFGYKAHTLVNEIKIIEKLAVTPANIHDSKIDLSIPGIICYRDKGYFGSECKGINGTMDRARSSTSCEEYTQESSNIPHPINSGTSLCILQRHVPFLPCNGDNSAEGKGEDILHRHMLQPSKGKIP